MTTTITVNDLYLPVAEDLEQAFEIFDAELHSDLPCVTALCRRLEGYRGKRLRPAMLLLVARATQDVTEAHRVAAAVVEMVHIATLVHDDVLDNAELRRNRRTVARVEGNVAAVLLGDFLISHAFHLCSGLDDQSVARRIGAVTNTVCEGELLQNALRGRPDMTQDEYLEIIRRKTGALTAVACRLGAEIDNPGSQWTRPFAEFGMHLGVAFQIVDDLLDLCGDRVAVGKTVGLDHQDGKMTLPALHSLPRLDPSQAETLRAMLQGAEPVDIDRLRALLEHTGSIEFTRNFARREALHAAAILEKLPDSTARTSLQAMVEFVLTRPL